MSTTMAQDVSADMHGLACGLPIVVSRRIRSRSVHDPKDTNLARVAEGVQLQVDQGTKCHPALLSSMFWTTVV